MEKCIMALNFGKPFKRSEAFEDFFFHNSRNIQAGSTFELSIGRLPYKTWCTDELFLTYIFFFL